MTHTATLQQIGDDLILPLSEELLKQAGLKQGDVLSFKHEDGAIVMTKKPMKTVLVETVSIFRMRYAVSIPEDAPIEWASDTVVCNEAAELSQEHLDETIVSSRVITDKEYIDIFDQDNAYLKDWSEEDKRKYITAVGLDEYDSVVEPIDDIEHSEHYYDTQRNR